MSHLSWKSVILAALLVAYRPVGGQTTSGPQQFPFRAGVDVVTLNVTVTDGSKRYVTDLRQDEFLILEDGRRQEAAFFREAGLPLALVLLLDTSASMRDSLAVSQEAAVGFARRLGPADVVSVIGFDTTIRVLQDFTGNPAAIEGAIRTSTTLGESTALYTALYVALKELNKVRPNPRTGEPPRRAIVLLSDGEDTSSLLTLDDMLDPVARSDTAIYAIGLGLAAAPSIRRVEDARSVLRRLAKDTGGRTFFPSTARDLTAVYAQITEELCSQYSLAYESSNPRKDGRFRQLSVHIDRRGVVSRTRAGYYAPSQ